MTHTEVGLAPATPIMTVTDLAGSPYWDTMNTICAPCAHDYPCGYSLLAQIDTSRMVGLSGNPEDPFTASFACAKVNREADIVWNAGRAGRHVPQPTSATLSQYGRDCRL
jgi:anaerobic selenocysteine-containing dehydrogenase